MEELDCEQGPDCSSFRVTHFTNIDDCAVVFEGLFSFANKLSQRISFGEHQDRGLKVAAVEDGTGSREWYECLSRKVFFPS